MKKVYLGLLLLLPFCASAQNLIFSSSFQGNADDISGNNLNAMVYGATLTTGQSGMTNTAYYFDGIDVSVVIPASPLMNLTEWTLHARFQPQGFYSGVCQGNFIINHGLDYYDDHYHMEFMDNHFDGSCSIQTDSESRIVVTPAGTTSSLQFLNGPPVVLNNWYCVVARYDGDSLKLSINGTLVATIGWASQYTTAPADGRPTYIGWSSWLPNFPYFFKGKIDKISIWDGAISDSLTDELCTMLDDTLGGTTSVPNASINEKITIGPNPARNYLNIALPSAHTQADVTITNIQGQVLQSMHVNTRYTSIDISELPSGMYLLNVSGERLRQTVKFVKQTE